MKSLGLVFRCQLNQISVQAWAVLRTAHTTGVLCSCKDLDFRFSARVLASTCEDT